SVPTLLPPRPFMAHTHPWEPDDRSLSRRQFLSCFAAGSTLAPALLLVSCGRNPTPHPGVTEPPPSGADDLVLRASRFAAAPDGRPREVMGYNGQLPGPVIRVKEGDTLRVKVVNQLGTVPTSIHWHGMHQPGTWRMDGVADVSRPPI